MSIRQKVWTGLAVFWLIILLPGVTTPLAVASLFFQIINVVPIAVLTMSLLLVRNARSFWWGAGPALGVLLLGYCVLRYSNDPQMPIALMFVPLYGALAAVVGTALGFGLDRRNRS